MKHINSNTLAPAAGPFSTAYSSYFNGTYPVRTCIAVADLPVNANVEMTVTAVLNETT
jgi:enamine deaminase RidA (YjgF/YER057c/UK114 family)